jgi:hypothetical protein
VSPAGGTRSGEEIQSALRGFVERWKDYSGTERSEAQTFLNELFECYGTGRLDVGARFEDFHSSATGTGFMDLHWPEVVIIEMKRPSRGDASRAAHVEAAREQLLRYWRESADEQVERPAARYVVLCSFQRFEIWEPGRFPKNPRVSFPIEELPDRYEALLFLAAPSLSASFVDHYKELTKDAAGEIARLYQSLADRSAAPIDEIQRFTMQCVWTLFAEDLGMLDGYPLQVIVDDLRRGRRANAAAEIGHLFRVLNQKGKHNRVGHLAGTRYVNGALFAQPAEVGLNTDELDLLSDAAKYDWRKVDPTIFGSLMEGVLGRERRWELGAHYTHEADIMKIVEPTVVRPWLARIDACQSPIAARELLDELVAFRVLDPACGCGNFLYIAYRELRWLEDHLKERITQLAQDQGVPVPAKPWPYYPLANLQGIDIEGIAVLIARVTLWMGHRQMVERFGEAEPVLPLVDLSGIQRADALRVPWPDTDAIIGNPPFLGDRNIRGAFGDDYVEWLEAEFGVGVKDFCTYWFRRAQVHLRPGQRAGLVGTNSISQNRARSVSLEYIVNGGGTITDAVSSQKWPGEAKVHVSLVNWVKGDGVGPNFLDGVPVPGIDPSLRANAADTWSARRIAANKRRAFYGPVPIGKGFVVSAAEAGMLRDTPGNSAVVRPYLTGSDITDAPDQEPRRWTIDFGTMPLEDARRFTDVLDIVRRSVKPDRDRNNRESYRRRWWQFGEPCVEMRAAIEGLPRFAVGLSTGKRACFVWADRGTSMNNSTVVFALEDDFSMGVLLSRAHGAWAWVQASTLETRLRYTPSSVFETFPWAGAFADAEQRERVAEASRRLLARRSEICLAEQIGLTTLYNQVDEGAWTDLKALHQSLDEAVAACYGWPAKVAQDDGEIVRRLVDLNRRIVESELPYAPFAYLDAAGEGRATVGEGRATQPPG